MLLVYIAGPFRGPSAWAIEQNIRRAETLALDVWRAGMAALCPHTNTRFFQGAADDRIWLEGDLEMLRRCDAVLLTEHWERSAGALAEANEARRLGIPVFDCLADLEHWRDLRALPESLDDDEIVYEDEGETARDVHPSTAESRGPQEENA